MMCDARLFAPQIAAFSGRRAVHVAPMLGDTIANIAASVIANAPPRFALAGLSMGGIVAMEILRQAPDMVSRLALLDTNPNAETPEVAAAREPQIARGSGGTARGRHARGDEAALPRTGAAPARGSEHRDGDGEGPWTGRLRQPVARPDAPPRCPETLRKADCPVWCSGGSHDTVCPVSRHEFMAGIIPNSTLEIIEDAGHLPTLEKPEETTAALDRWLHDRLLLS